MEGVGDGILPYVSSERELYFGFLLGLTSEHLVAATGLVFLIPLAVATYGIGRATGADETASLLSVSGL